MENHHFQWENSQKMVIFNSKLLVYQRVSRPSKSQMFSLKVRTDHPPVGGPGPPGAQACVL
jgi:hypothetical protein